MKTEMEATSRSEKKKKRSKKRVFLWFLMTSVLFLVIGGISYSSFIYSKAKAVVSKSYAEIDKSDKRDTEVAPLKDNISILIMGVDESEKRKSQYGEAVRTDALLLATINKNDKSVKLVSIPRDSRVYIPSKKKL
ncbi:LCP family protein, partial [Bacillus cereus]